MKNCSIKTFLVISTLSQKHKKKSTLPVFKRHNQKKMIKKKVHSLPNSTFVWIASKEDDKLRRDQKAGTRLEDLLPVFCYSDNRQHMIKQKGSQRKKRVAAVKSSTRSDRFFFDE